MEHDVQPSIALMEQTFVEHEDSNLFVQLAAAYRGAGDAERAMHVLRRGLERHPSQTQGFALLGFVLRDLGREAEAAICFEQLLEMDPANAVARSALEEIPPVLTGRRKYANGNGNGFAVGGTAQVRSEVEADPRVIELRRRDTAPADAEPRHPFTRSGWSGSARPARLHGDSPWMPTAPAAPTDPATGGSAGRPASPMDGGFARGHREESARAAGTGHARLTPTGEPGADSSVVELADLLVGLLEFRDPFFRGGTSMTRLLTEAIARQLGVSEPAVSQISLGAILRDLGQIPLKGFIEKAGTELDAADRRHLAGHVDTALQLLGGIRLPQVTMETIRHHHEWWNGAGYPDGLSGDAIPLGARIVAVADSLAAMIAARPHRLPMRVRDAVADIRTRNNRQYDPAVVEALVQVLTGTEWRGLPFGLRHRILVVDPDDTRAMVTATKLCANGYLAETTSSAEAARERLRHSRIAGLVISADLPEGSDAALLADVRDVERHGLIPVIVTQAAADRRARLLEAGADVGLAPDSAFEELKATIEAFLRREGGPLDPDSRPDSSWSRLRGDLQEFPLSWLLQVLNYDARTAAVFIAGKGDAGVIYLDEGNPRHAETMFLRGEDALRAMLKWPTGSFSVDPDATTGNESIQSALMKLLLDDAVQDDHTDFFGAVKVT